MNENLQKLKELTDQLIDRDFLLKKKQEMLEKLLSSSPVPVLIWLTDEELVFVSNAGSLPEVGIRDADRYIGLSIYEYFKTEDRNSTPIKEILSALEGNTVSYVIEHRSRYLWTRCTPVQDYVGKIIGVMGVTWDLTALHKSREVMDAIILEKPSISQELYRKVESLMKEIDVECSLKKE